jgi:hypothetical protein
MSTLEATIPSASIQDPRFTEAGRTKISHRPPDDSNLTRIAWMPTFDIDLRHMSGSSYVGAFPDERIRKRTLIFFREGDAASFRPKEIPAMVTNEESRLADNYLPAAEAIDLMGIIDPLDKSMVNCQFVLNTPRFCANTLMRQYHKYGMQLFEHLNGREKDARKLYDIIYPADVIPVTARERVNVTFEGPFLDEIFDYLKRNGRANIEKSRKRFIAAGKERAARLEADGLRMLAQMISGCATAWGHQNATLNKTEQLIRLKRNGKEGKDWYDVADERFDNPWPAPDLVFLADTNRMPLDLQELAASQKMAEETGRATSKNLEGVLERFFGNVNMAQSADPRYAALEAKVDAVLELARRRPDLAAELGEIVSAMKPDADSEDADELAGSQPDPALIQDALAEAGIDPEEIAAAAAEFDGTSEGAEESVDGQF